MEPPLPGSERQVIRSTGEVVHADPLIPPTGESVHCHPKETEPVLSRGKRGRIDQPLVGPRLRHVRVAVADHPVGREGEGRVEGPLEARVGLRGKPVDQIDVEPLEPDLPHQRYRLPH